MKLKMSTIRLSVGLTVISTHFLAFLAIVVLRRSYFPSDDRLDLAMLLLPITATYVMAIVRSAIRDKETIDEARYVNINYVVVVGIITLGFCIGLLFFVYGYPNVGGPTVDNLRRWILVLEIAFGAAFGLIAEDLFGKIEKISVEK